VPSRKPPSRCEEDRTTVEASSARDAGGSSSNGDPLHELAASVVALQGEIRRLAEARIDRIRLSMRDRVVVLFAQLAGAVILISVIVAAIVLIMHGVATAIGGISGGRAWLGEVLAGGGFVLAAVGLVLAAEVRTRMRERRQLEEKYARPERESAAGDAQAPTDQ